MWTRVMVLYCGLMCSAATSRAMAQRQVQKLTGPAQISGSSYGARSTFDSDWAIVTAASSNVVALGAGQAFVYHRVNGVWQETQQLFASDAHSSDLFGSSVEISGDYAVVGARGANGGASVTGVAYVFERVGSTWVERQKLVPSIPLGQGQFGNAVAIDGDRIVVGAWFDSLIGTQVGSAYVYERVGSSWSEVARLQPSDLPAGAHFGISVSIDGDHVACGTHWGKLAYVFHRDAQGLWSQEQKLIYTGNSLALTWNYGARVSLAGSTLFVSSEDTVGSAVQGGRSYVYNKLGGVWTESQTITSLDVESSDFFSIVESNGDYAVGIAEDQDNGVGSAATYVFKRVAGSWTQIAKVLPNDGYFQQRCNCTPTIHGSTLMVGASGDDEACATGQNCNTGAAYFFDLALDSTQYGSCWPSGACANLDNHGGCRNSTGVGAILQASGIGSIATDDLVLEVREMPAGTATMMFMGAGEGAVTLGSGQLVALGGSLGLYRLGVQFADADGVVVRPPGLVAYSQTLGGFGAITAGQTWNFQCWYRDIASPCGITNNLSNGLSVQFTP